MKPFIGPFALGFVFCLVVLFSATGCAMRRAGAINQGLTAPTPAYEQALAGAAATEIAGGSAAAVERFLNLFETYTVANLRANTQKVYAEDVFFRDGIHGFNSAAEVEDYLVAGLEPLKECRFEFFEVAENRGEYFVRWNMHVATAKDKELTSTLGMTHIRFNAEGQVVFHQDYWDPTDMIYSRIPIAAGLIRAVRKRL